MECFMGCSPPPGGGQEAFYIAVLKEFTIYGHSINRWTRENYPEDWPLVRDTQKNGMYWGCWHSPVCWDGEIGSQNPAICVPMEKVIAKLGLSMLPVEFMERASELKWPDLQSLIGTTSDRPSVSIWVPPEGADESAEALFEGMREGTLREVWNSLEGDKDDATDQAREN